MNIIVCVKRVLDPKMPADQFKLDTQAKRVLPPEGVQIVMSPYDEHAVELALKLKDKHGGKVTAITLGSAADVPVVKHAIAMGADDGYVLADPAFDGADSLATAHILSKAIQKIGSFDLVLCGRQAADWDSGQVGSGIAEILGIPSVTVAKKIEVVNGKARVERITPDGYEVIEVSLPALVTVSNELGEPRYPTIKGIMAAKRKEPIVWKPADIGVTPTQIGAAGRRTKLLKLFQPVREGKCEVIQGETPEEMAANLALRLRQAKML